MSHSRFLCKEYKSLKITLWKVFYYFNSTNKLKMVKWHMEQLKGYRGSSIRTLKKVQNKNIIDKKKSSY